MDTKQWVTSESISENGTALYQYQSYRVFFFTGPLPKKLKYGKPRLSKVRCIWDVLDTRNLA